jgi:DNA-binding NtrC family response regulator
MDLVSSLLQQLADPGLSHQESVRLRCTLAKEMEEASNYEAARSILENIWRRIGERPDLEGLDRFTAAEVLQRVGALSGWIGSARQIEGSQEIAKDLISESAALFEELHEEEKACEARTNLAICYWREGAFDEARVILNNVLTRLDGKGSTEEIRALINLALIEKVTHRYNDSLSILINAAPLLKSVDNHALKGRFHNQLAGVLKTLGAAERRSDYIDRALVEYAAASFHFGEADNLRYRARVENNLGFLFLTNGRYAEAHEHLDRARRLFVSLKDRGSIAQVDDTRARAFLQEGRAAEAERVVRAAVRTLEEGGEQALLAEALTTWGMALARMEKRQEARATLERAIEAAESAGHSEGAGLAVLTLLEEVSGQLGLEERRALYERADELLTHAQHPGILARLRRAARETLSHTTSTEQPKLEEGSLLKFVYASDEMAAILRRANRIATTSQPLLITGETGTGKELLARLVHEWSGRAGEFVVVNCGALSEGMFESELFGHRQGSFKDALEDYPGLIRQAAGGTLLLDEVAELSPGAQAKLLRVIERGEVQTIGASLPEVVDVRIIAASRQDIKQSVARGSFRPDLFYRLEAFHVEIPPLRERAEDTEALAKHFIGEALRNSSRRVTFTPEAVAALRRLPLEGNARQLRFLIERTVMTADDATVITAEAVETAGLRRAPMVSFANPWEGFSLKDEVRRFEARFIELALKEAKGKVSQAARLLGFRHHESLASLLETKHRDLLAARIPATPRRRSIIRHNNSKLKRQN